MKDASPLTIVERWQDAVNRRDKDELISLSAPDIEIVGPRGVASGHHVLLEWIERAGITLRTARAFANLNHVVLLQEATWMASGEDETSAQAVASSFYVEDGQVTRVTRFDSLADALEGAGLNESHAIQPESAG